MHTNTHPRPLFDRLEPRQHMAVDLSATTVVPRGAYGAGDLFDIDVKLKNSGGSNSDLPAFVKVVLSRDTKLGNADDIDFSGNVFLGTKKGKTATQQVQAAIQGNWKAGDYYVITQADPFGSFVFEESNTKNNVSVSKTREIRLVTDKAPDGFVFKGTSRDDVIAVQGNFANEIVTINGVSKRFTVAGSLKPLTIDAGGGNDKITCDRGVNGATILRGGAGNDTIVGGTYNDVIDGGSGNDVIHGNDGADQITAGAGNDWIDGGAGVDRINGGSGKDKAKRHKGDAYASVEALFNK